MQSTGHGSRHLPQPEQSSGMMITSMPWLKMAPNCGGQWRMEVSQLMQIDMSISSGGFFHLGLRSWVASRSARDGDAMAAQRTARSANGSARERHQRDVGGDVLAADRQRYGGEVALRSVGSGVPDRSERLGAGA